MSPPPVLPLFKKHKWRLTLLFLFVVAHALLGLFLMRHAANTNPLFFLLALLTSTLFTFFTEVTLLPMEISLTQEQLQASFQAHCKSDPRNNNLAHWHARSENARFFAQWVSSLLRTIFKRLLQVFLFGASLFLIDWRLALLILPFLLLYFLPSLLFGNRTRKLRRAAFRYEGELHSFEADAMGGRGLFFISPWDTVLFSQFARRLSSFLKKERRHRFWHLLLSPLLFSVTLSLFALVWSIGNLFVSHGTLTKGALFSFLTGLFLLFPVLSGLGRDLLITFSLKPLSLPHPAISGVPQHLPHHSISLRNLSFSYDSPLLQRVNCTFYRGTLTAITGPNGSGKSTVLALLMGHFPPDGGTILVDSQPALPHPSHIGYQDQNATLFPDTAQFNIQLGRSPTSCPPIFGPHPKGPLSAAQVSGGERRKIALERAFYGFPSLILLDEPEDALDHDSLSLLIETLKKAKKRGCIGIVVTHHPKVIAACDQQLLLTPQNRA